MGRVLPVLFNTDMVQAILDGRKGATRRICKDADEYTVPDMGFYDSARRTYAVHQYTDKMHKNQVCTVERPCLACPGDILYVRETWCTGHDGEAYFYRADKNTERASKLIDYDDRRWRPSIHMPKAAARIWLKVTDVRVERLQEIRDFRAEGIRLSEGCEECLAVCGECNRDETPIGCDNEIKLFADLWDSTLSRRDKGRYGWEANPWVWVIELERCGKPETR